MIAFSFSGGTDIGTAIFGLGLVIAFANIKATLLFDLSDVKRRYLQTGVFQNVFLDLRVGRVAQERGHIEFLQGKIDLDIFSVDLSLGKSDNTFNCCFFKWGNCGY